MEHMYIVTPIQENTFILSAALNMNKFTQKCCPALSLMTEYCLFPRRDVDRVPTLSLIALEPLSLNHPGKPV